jgi:hypothetical protein
MGNIYDFQKEVDSALKDCSLDVLLLIEGWSYKVATFNCPFHAANEGPVKIQYKCLDPIYVLPEMKLLFPK